MSCRAFWFFLERWLLCYQKEGGERLYMMSTKLDGLVNAQRDFWRSATLICERPPVWVGGGGFIKLLIQSA